MKNKTGIGPKVIVGILMVYLFLPLFYHAGLFADRYVEHHGASGELHAEVLR